MFRRFQKRRFRGSKRNFVAEGKKPARPALGTGGGRNAAIALRLNAKVDFYSKVVLFSEET